jgi:hypothetical protein
MNQSVEHSTVIGFCPEQAENMEMKTTPPTNSKTFILAVVQVTTHRKQEGVQ